MCFSVFILFSLFIYFGHEANMKLLIIQGNVHSGSSNCDSEIRHLMASALCLRVLCSQEKVQPNPKVLLLKRLVSSIELLFR